MKKILLFIVIFSLLPSCKKVAPIPTVYYGTWIAETPQFLSTNDRIHTLKIYNDSKGRPYGEYTSKGQYQLLDEKDFDFVKVANNRLIIGKKEFTIEKNPFENEEGEIEMHLSTLVFKKT